MQKLAFEVGIEKTSVEPSTEDELEALKLKKLNLLLGALGGGAIGGGGGHWAGLGRNKALIAGALGTALGGAAGYYTAPTPEEVKQKQATVIGGCIGGALGRLSYG